jgi:hypothetical protein
VTWKSSLQKEAEYISLSCRGFLLLDCYVCLSGYKHGTHMPFLRGRSFVRIVLKSGRSSGFSAQHSTRQSRTKLKLFSSSSSCGLRAHDSIANVNCTWDPVKIIMDENRRKNKQIIWVSKLLRSTYWHT